MIEVIGSFATIGLVLWLLLSIVFVLFYPVIRPALMATHPRNGSFLLLAYWSGPFLVSLFCTCLLYMPGLESLLVDAHCHADCGDHLPVLGSTGLAFVAIGLSLGILLLLTVRVVVNLLAGWRMQHEFAVLSHGGRRFRVIASDRPLVFTLGWWRPQIYFSEALLQQCTPGQLDVILSHEQEHSRRRDNLRLLLVRAFGLLLPARFYGQIKSDARSLIEQACDFRAAETYGAFAVAETLLHIQRLMQGLAQDVPRHAAAFLECDVETRITAVLEGRSRIVLSDAQVLVLMVLLAGCFMATVAPLHHASERMIALLTTGLFL
ncbi:MAG: hypothetical protein RLZZ385_2226 [Pseudomonadota bacterium]|jgi:Zn-dependent protease with chaperone function